MSKFFRKNPDSDSSSSASDSEELEEDDDYFGQQDDSHLAQSQELEVATPPVQGPPNAVAAAGPNKDLLLHALLEEKCLNDVRSEHAGKSTSEAAIVIEARNRYQILSAQLSRVGLTAPGLDGDAHVDIRQQYRDGLDVFAKANARPGRSTANIRPPQRRMITGVEGPTPADLTNFQNLQISPTASLPLSLGPYVAQPPIFGTRFTQDFEELGVLGKGGYGIVYQCRHKLDGVVYAVKKVPVSESRQQQILLRGQSEIDELLSELRTLAQLDHPNIVRYFNGWLDYMNLDAAFGNNGAGFSDVGAGAEDTRTGSFSPGRVVEANDDHIMFENSVSRGTTTSTASKASTASDNELRRTASHATRATVSDEDDIESISRSADSNLITGTDGLQLDVTKPQLAVHMQMALYPMTLTDFLSDDSPKPPTTVAPPLRHCFHLKPSVRILLAILDGVAYLHQNKIVHRDLKPGNIFLAPSTSSRLPDGSVDLSLCDACSGQGSADPISLKVRIGDFGLVTALATAGEEAAFDSSSPSKPPVGTELYNPPDGVRGNASPALDVYAAGVIAFELLWPFGTRMERHETLTSLKSGRFPAKFNERIGDPSGGMEACVREMLRPDHPPVEELRQRLSAII